MTDRLDDVWTTRDYPVLREVARRIDGGQRYPSDEDVAAAVGLSVAQVRLSGNALQRRGLVRVSDDTDDHMAFDEVSGAAYLITGLHPDGEDALASLVSALRQAADLTGDEDERTRLQRAASSLMDLGRGVAGAVLTAWITAQMPH